MWWLRRLSNVHSKHSDDVDLSAVSSSTRTYYYIHRLVALLIIFKGSDRFYFTLKQLQEPCNLILTTLSASHKYRGQCRFCHFLSLKSSITIRLTLMILGWYPQSNVTGKANVTIFKYQYQEVKNYVSQQTAQ